MTLIEVMVVLAIVAMAASGLSVGLGALTKSGLRNACMKLASASRYAYQRALSHGVTVRLTMDFENNTFTLDESEDPISLVRSDDMEREEAQRNAEDEDEEAETGAAVNAWDLAARKVDNPDELTFGKPPFSPITTMTGTTIKRLRDQELGRNIAFYKVIVAHEEEPREGGRVDLFFFPNGSTQHAVVQLVDSSETVYSVELHPLTGKATVHDVPYEPEVLLDDPTLDVDESSELEDDR